MQVLEKGEQSSKPSQTIAKIEAHVKINVFGARASALDSKAKEALKQKACALGGDGLVITDKIYSEAVEFKSLHVWAEVFIFQ